MRVRGHRERAPGAGGSVDARPRASGKGPGGGQRRGRRHQERAPGREASGTSAGIGKGPRCGQQRGWVAAGTRVRGRWEPMSAGMGKGPRVMHPKAARRRTAASTHVKAARRLTVVARRTPKPDARQSRPEAVRGCRTASGRTGHTSKPPGRMPKPPRGAAARPQASGKGPGVGIGGDTHPPRGRAVAETRQAAVGTRFRGHQERARCAGGGGDAPPRACICGHWERPRVRAAAGMRGHRERAPGAGSGRGGRNSKRLRDSIKIGSTKNHIFHHVQELCLLMLLNVFYDIS
jgi:hypothetical protein